MFGFTQSPTACCQKNAHSTYRGFFCGLSCKLKDDYGHSARFLVNRDSTFLSLIGAAITTKETNYTKRTCCNPLANPSPLNIASDIQQYSAAVAICGLAAKCDDDRHDYHGLRQWSARSLSTLMQPWRERAIATLNSTAFPTSEVLHTLSRQSEFETPQHFLAEASAPTAKSYQSIFAHLAEFDHIPKSNELATIGFSLGQLIYLRDAVDDWEKDLKRNHYNPLRHHDLEELKSLCSDSLSHFQSAVAALPLRRHQKTISSIVTQTVAYHSDLTSEPQAKKQRKKKRKNSNSCWDSCCVCDCCSGCNLGDLSCGRDSSSACNCDSGCGDCCSGGDCCSCDCCSCG